MSESTVIVRVDNIQPPHSDDEEGFVEVNFRIETNGRISCNATFLCFGVDESLSLREIKQKAISEALVYASNFAFYEQLKQE